MTSPRTLLAEIQQAATEYRELLAKAADAKARRDQHIREASATHAIKQVEITRAAGLTRERIRNIAGKP